MNREEKKQARIDRYEELSHKSMEHSNSAYEQSYKMTSVIPFGQPILVGHHSEARHRNLINRSWNKMGESVKLQEKAEYYQQKAEATANNNAIYLDDDNVVEKLEEKIARLEKLQEQMKQTNKIIRAAKTTKEQKMELLQQLGLSDKVIDELFSQKYTREIGFPSYSLTNNNANLRRLKQRLEKTKQLKEMEEKEYVINEVRVVENAPENRLQLFFDGKPNEETRKKLKTMGFRWSPTNGCWQSYYNRWQVERAKGLLANL